MYDVTVEPLEPNRVTRYVLKCEGDAMAFGEVLRLWRTSEAFRCFFSEILQSSPFPAFRWETPALTESRSSRSFEFVLLNAPSFETRTTDPLAFQNVFTGEDDDHGVVAFTNLGGDATLVIPSPRSDLMAYGHLAAFVRHAPKAQVSSFWRVLGDTVQKCLGPAALWLSTAGGGVAWLHARIDSRPKYYGYGEYRNLSRQWYS